MGADGTTELLAQAVTSTDGRTDAPLLHGHQLLRGTYEFTFAVGSISAPVP